MYSVVLMMALGAGGDLPACHRGHGGCGHRGGCHGGGCGGGSCGGGGYCGGGGCGGGGCGGGYCGGGYGGGSAGGACYAYGGYVGTGTAVVATEAPATIVVSVPADAKVTIDNNPTTSTSDRRVFVSPSLPLGRDYHYSVQAKVMRDGKPVTVAKTITVRAGEETQVSLDVPATTAVASR
jgi:uncharacterized protein (TIGR03000 family)